MDGRADLSPYLELPRRLETGQVTPGEVLREVRREWADLPDAANAVQELVARARTAIPRGPRHGWVLARLACAVAGNLALPLLAAESALTLARGLNTRGEFAEAIPLAREAAISFASQEETIAAARCYR